MALTVGLRAPWFGAPLGNDEGGLTYIAAHWQDGGPYLYGDSFIDRPPLLIALFRIASEAGGTAAVRTIGALAAGLLVVIVALVAREVGGRRAAAPAAFIAAILASSPALGSVFTPAELLAVLPSAGSVLLLLLAQRASHTRLLCFALAGVLALIALLVKQSFGDALVAGAVCLAAGAYLEKENRRRRVADAAAYVAGICLVLLCLELWEGLSGARDGSTAYALLGFRVEGLSALAGSAGGLPGRLADRLVLPLFASGLALVFLWSVAGMRNLGGRPVIRATVVGWALAGLAGVLLGGSYWPHYLIELIPVAAVTAGLALATAGQRWTRITAAALAAVALGAVVIGPSLSRARSSEYDAKAVGSYIGERASADDTLYVRYAQPNITYYSGLRNPYAYDWSLMLRTIPDAQSRLRALLRSDGRPTWVVEWEPASAYGLDGHGTTAKLLRRHYRDAATVCGVPVLLERGRMRPAPDRLPGACS